LSRTEEHGLSRKRRKTDGAPGVRKEESLGLLERSERRSAHNTAACEGDPFLGEFAYSYWENTIFFREEKSTGAVLVW